MMYRRLIAAMLLPLTLFLLTGCGSAGLAPTGDLGPRTRVAGVGTQYGDRERPDELTVVEKDTLRAEIHGQPFAFPASDAEFGEVPGYVVALWVGAFVVLYGVWYVVCGWSSDC